MVSEKTHHLIFFGTPDFALPSLEMLHHHGFAIAGVVTNPDKPAGRGHATRPGPVAHFARVHGLPLLQPESLRNEETRSELVALAPDYFIVAAYGKIIPPEILALAPLGSLNVHPSLLPKFRGASPIQSAILSGDAETGVTIMLLDEEMDHGPILAQRKIGIPPGITGPDLSNLLAHEGAGLLIHTIPLWLAGTVAPMAQDHARATYSKLLKREDGRLDWRKPAEILAREVRAFLGWPESFTFWHRDGNSLRLKVEEARAIPAIRLGAPPGTVSSSPEHAIAVETSQGSLAIVRLVPEGKRPMDAQEFLRGHREIIGAVLK